MAWLDKRGDNFRLVFQIGGQTFKRSLRTSDQREADGMVSLVERGIKVVERGELAVPEDAELASFLVADGKMKTAVVVTQRVSSLTEAMRSRRSPGHPRRR